MSFIHLHNHTHYTFQQALGNPKKLAARAKELGQEAIAITDAGNLYGAFEFYQACENEGVKPIIGVEFQISKKGRANREKDNELYEIVLLAKNLQGYHNLIQLVTKSQLEGYVGGQPRIDFELLEEFGNNIIALSGSMYGEIGQAIITGKEDSYIIDRIEYYINIFGSQNFFLEIQEHPDRAMQPKINETIIRIAKDRNYQYVGTNNAYYITTQDAEVQDMMSAVAAGRELDDPDRSTLMEGDYSIRCSDEMKELFVYAPEAYENTQKIANMIDLKIDYGEYKIPVFPLSDDQKAEFEVYKESVKQHNATHKEQFQSFGSEEWFLRQLCIKGLNTRYGFGFDEKQQDILLQKIIVPKEKREINTISVEELQDIAKSSYSQEKKDLISHLDEEKKFLVDRLEYELSVVNIMGFNGYFCIVADFILYGKEHGVPVGPGRGSAAGAILAYLSGITDIDPIKYGLLFERFLNPSRVSMPDIDVDFSDEGRDKVLSYVREKYGADHVTQVCTFGTLAARAAVKDAGRALGIPFQEMNDFAKLIPAKPGISLKGALEESPEFKEAYETNTNYKKVIDSAIRLEGTVRQLGVHACAVIIAPEPMTHFCPLQPPPKDPSTTVTQFSAGPLEDLGLLKMDFLGLRNLAILDRAVKIVKDVHGVEIDLLKIDYEDPKVLSLFGEGDTTGVFQFESVGMRRYLKDLKPSSFEDLIAMVSLYRPGPLQYIPEFIDRKFGRKTVEYPHPSLENILKPTYGIAVYQEQIMQIVQAFAGFSLGEADILRRAIGKKKYKLLMEQREKFIDAAIQAGHPKDLAVYIFDDIIEPFAGYGFNKSHAACYSMIAYQTAYMKTYYPTESMVALMVSDEEDTDRIRLEIEEARAKGIEILPPDVNESRGHFTFIDNANIRFGLKAIKGLGDVPIAKIRESVKKQKFTSIEDFISRTGGAVINKKSLESLIYSGALDQFGERNSLLKSIPKMTAYLKEIEHKNETSQIGLFDMMEDDSGVSFELEKAEPMTFEKRLKGEKEMIGYPVSGHPMDMVGDFVEQKSKNTKVIYDWIERRNSGDDLIQENEDTQENLEGTSSGQNEKNDTKKDKSQQKQKEESQYATLIGFIAEVRHIPTKSGGKMIVARVESKGFDFRILVFPKDFDAYQYKIQEDHMVIANGRLRFDDERGEISVSPSAGFGKKDEAKKDTSAVKVFTISQFFALAKRFQKGDTHEDAHEQDVKRYTIVVPPFWTRDDLLELKKFLESQEKGDIEIFISISDKKKTTKIFLASIEKLKKWVGERI
ncbi:DNA polymerase III subunit alpha [Candidatus Gracilibacteria bacterium]|nr:MAG: DNA polymerase III subunit alpha [Candidatus Gracilibacteria bacterium]